MPPEIIMRSVEKEIPPTKSGMVTVACKHPSGLVLEIDESREEVPSPGASRVKVYFGTGRTVTLNGSNAGHPDSPQYGARVVAGFGLTDIPESFWDEWVAQHKGFPMLINGTLFAHKTNDAATGEAIDKKGLKNGLEPMDPARPGPGLERDNGRAI